MNKLTREQFVYAVNSLSRKNYENTAERVKFVDDLCKHDDAQRKRLKKCSELIDEELTFP